jgi:hypothetical protein
MPTASLPSARESRTVRLPRGSLWLCAAAIAGATLLPARAEALPSEPHPVTPSPHRLSVALSEGAALVGGDIDGHWNDSGNTLGLGLRYSYDFGVELGAELDLMTVPDAQRQLLLPTLSVRPHLALSPRTELGLSARAGGLWMFMSNVPDDSAPGSVHDHVWSGYCVSLSPDVRYWVNRKFAFAFGPEAILGPAKDTSGVRGWYLSDQAGILFFGVSLKGVYAP